MWKYEASTGPSGNIVITNSLHMNEPWTTIAELQKWEVAGPQWSCANNCSKTDDTAHIYYVGGLFWIKTLESMIRRVFIFQRQAYNRFSYSQVVTFPRWCSNDEVRVSTVLSHTAGEQAMVITGIHIITVATRCYWILCKQTGTHAVQRPVLQQDGWREINTDRLMCITARICLL